MAAHPVTGIDRDVDRFCLCDISDPENVVVLSSPSLWPTIDGRPWVGPENRAYVKVVAPPFDAPSVGWQHKVIGVDQILNLLEAPFDNSLPIGTFGTLYREEMLPAADQKVTINDTYKRCVAAIYPSNNDPEAQIEADAAMLTKFEGGTLTPQESARLQSVRNAKDLINAAKARRDVLSAVADAGQIDDISLAAPNPGGWPISWALIQAAGF